MILIIRFARRSNWSTLEQGSSHSSALPRRVLCENGADSSTQSLRATLDVPKPESGGLVKKVGPFSKRKNPV